MKNEKRATSTERIIIGGETDVQTSPVSNSRISAELLQKFEGKSREVIVFVFCLYFCWNIFVVLGLDFADMRATKWPGHTQKETQRFRGLLGWFAFESDGDATENFAKSLC